jgi:imidazoleglycerol-phosphate dehydratase
VIDGTGRSTIRTGVGFFDHTPTALSPGIRLRGPDLTALPVATCHIDADHTVEDCGPGALGQSLSQQPWRDKMRRSLGAARASSPTRSPGEGFVATGRAPGALRDRFLRSGPTWSGCCSGQNSAERDVSLEDRDTGHVVRVSYSASASAKFFQAFANEAKLQSPPGAFSPPVRPHHVVEALFKAVRPVAVDSACQRDPRLGDQIPSSSKETPDTRDGQNVVLHRVLSFPEFHPPEPPVHALVVEQRLPAHRRTRLLVGSGSEGRYGGLRRSLCTVIGTRSTRGR